VGEKERFKSNIVALNESSFLCYVREGLVPRGECGAAKALLGNNLVNILGDLPCDARSLFLHKLRERANLQIFGRE